MRLFQVFWISMMVVVFTSLSFAAPQVASISPTSGPVGTQVTVTGTGFGATQGTSTLKLGNASNATATVVSWTDTQIVATVPGGAASTSPVAVKVTVGGVTSNTNVTYAMTAPQVTSISPSSGVVGTQVTITGSGFGESRSLWWNSYVYIGGVSATVGSWSDTQIVATVLSGAKTGAAYVRVNGTGTVDSNKDVVFTMPNPQVTSISPTSGPVGTQVTVTGTGFGETQGTSTVKLGTNSNATATVLSWTDTQIVATVPGGAASTSPVAVKVTVGGVESNSNVTYAMTPPQVTSISPNSGGAGTQVTVSGSGFGATKTVWLNPFVYVGGKSATVVSWSDTQIVATVASGAATGPVYVQVTGTGTVSSNKDVVFTMPNPQVTSISPTSGPVGTQVTLTGTGFGETQGTSTLQLGNASNATATVVSWSDTQILATVPGGAASTSPVAVKVTVSGVASNTNVTYAMTAPQVTSISPSSGVVGTQVTITGSGFGASNTVWSSPYVYIGGKSATVVSWSDTQVVATVASGATTGPAYVQVSGTGTVSSNKDVVFTMPNPQVASISPTSGPVGTQVTVTGSGFGETQASSTLKLGNASNATATVLSWSDTQIVASVPGGAASTSPVAVKVTVGGVESNTNVTYAMTPPQVTSISPSSGVVGTQVTITGSGFGTSRSVWWNSNVYIGGISAAVGSWSDTQIVATAAFGAKTGAAYVSVNGTGTVESNKDVVFTMPNPQVASISPTSGPVGTQVTLTGTGFGETQGTSTLQLGNASNATATVVSWSDTQIVATVPGGAASTSPVTVKVTVGGVASNTNVTYAMTPPQVTSISPSSGGVGTQVTITGSGFGASRSLWWNSYVSIGGISAMVVSWSDTQIAATVLSGARTGAAYVSVNGTSTVESNQDVVFTMPNPQVASTSPTSGPAGTPVTVTGSGFGESQGDSTVKFASTSATVVSWSDTQIVAAVPGGVVSTSPVAVKVTVGGVTSNTNVTFTATLPEIAFTTVLTNSEGHVTTYTLGAYGGVLYALNGDGPSCSSCTSRSNFENTFDGAGNLLTTTDALGHTTTYTYDANHNVTSISIQADDGSVARTTYTYNGFGQVLTVTDALGNTTTNEYDDKGNLISITSPSPGGGKASSVTRFAYDSKGQLTSITDPRSAVTSIGYTSAGLVQSITDAEQHTTTYEYDVRGNRTAVVDANDKRTTFAYDVNDHLTGITYPDSTTVSFGYDYRGRRTSVTDQNGKTTVYAYDDADRLVSVTDAAGNATQYAYDTESNLTGITDAMGRTTSFSYDAYGRVIQTLFPSTAAEFYAYDAVGNLTRKTDRKDQSITYVYDALNHLAHKGYPDSTGVDYVYDLVGKIKQVTDQSGTYSFAYDNMGRLLGTTTQYSFLPGQTFTSSYDYDAASNRTSATFPDGSTSTYQYDSLNRLTDLTNSWSGHFTFGYDALSRRTSFERPNNVNTAYSYDSVSRLLSVLHQTGATTTDGAAYTYDDAGNRTAKTNYTNNTSEQYVYHALYQLKEVTQSGTVAESYSYDAVGNRLASLGVASYTHDASNRLLSTPSLAFTYDLNGNTLSKTDAGQQTTTTYTWDVENRLTSILQPSGTVTFRYDPFGRRIQKSGPSGVTNYVYDGASIVAEYDAAGNVIARYTQGVGIDEPLAMQRGGTTAYYNADGLGSVTALTDSNGSAIAAYTTDAFGRSTLAAGQLFNPFRFTGREWDQETGLYYYRARYYDPTIGRFLSEDPIGFDGGINFYAYVGNDPTDWVDPFGWQRDRGKTGRPDGTDNPFKKLKPDPDDSTKVIYTDPDTGKKIKKAKPDGFDDWWKKKHPTKCQANGPTMFELQLQIESAQYMEQFWKDILIGGYFLGVVGTGGALGVGSGAGAGGLIVAPALL